MKPLAAFALVLLGAGYAHGDFRHTRSGVVAAVGGPRHRVADVVATTADDAQVIAGKLAYGKADKDLEDEDVEIFVKSGAKPIATARTNGDGRFTISLRGKDRLPAGLHELYASVVGDRSTVAFVAFVAPARSKIIVSDVDGTLTSSERAYWKTVITHQDPSTHPSAAKALSAAAAKGYQVIYITARGEQFTSDTRRWLDANGFPRGPLRLAETPVVIPGKRTTTYKSSVLASLVANFEIVAGVGNRATDISAYTNAGLAPDRIFIKLPEFVDELKTQLDAKLATAIAHYDELLARVDTL